MSDNDKNLSLMERIFALDDYAKTHDIDRTVSKVFELFPKEEFNYEEINNTMYDYIDRRTVINLPNTTDSSIVVKYPGGDRFGAVIAEDYIDIMISYKDKYEYMVAQDKYNSNNIKNNIEDILSNDGYTKEEVLQKLTSNDVHILKRLTPEQKQDEDVINAVRKAISEEADYRRERAQDQYDYGQYGDLEIADWKRKTYEQLNHIRMEYFSDIEENQKMNDALLKDYYNDPAALKDFKEEMYDLKEKIDSCLEIYENHDNYQMDIKNAKQDIESHLDQFEQFYSYIENAAEKHLKYDSDKVYNCILKIEGGNISEYEKLCNNLVKVSRNVIAEKQAEVNKCLSNIEGIQKNPFQFRFIKERKINEIQRDIDKMEHDISEEKNNIILIEKNKPELLSCLMPFNKFERLRRLDYIINETINYDKPRYYKESISCFKHDLEIQDKLLEKLSNDVKTKYGVFTARLEDIRDKLVEYAEKTPENEQFISELNDIIKENENIDFTDERKTLLNENGLLNKSIYEREGGHKKSSQETGIKGMVERAKQKKECMERNDDHKKIVEKGIER